MVGQADGAASRSKQGEGVDEAGVSQIPPSTHRSTFHIILFSLAALEAVDSQHQIERRDRLSILPISGTMF